MTRMLIAPRGSAIAQSIASMTSLGLARAVGAEHLQVRDPGARRHAAIPSLPASRDDARDVRAVPVLVAGRALRHR